MPDVFQFPKLDIDRERITLYRTPFPKALSDTKIAQLAQLHGLKAKPQDAGSIILVRDRRATLELFLASDSIRWSTLANGKAESRGNGGPPKLTDEATARKAAAAFLRERKVPTKGAAVDSITHAMLSRATPKSRKVEEQPVAVHVNYRFELEGLPVLGPGAKIQVTFVDAKAPAEMYRF